MMDLIKNILAVEFVLIVVGFTLLFSRPDRISCVAELSYFLWPSKSWYVNILWLIFFLLICVPLTIPYSIKRIWENSN